MQMNQLMPKTYATTVISVTLLLTGAPSSWPVGATVAMPEEGTKKREIERIPEERPFGKVVR